MASTRCHRIGLSFVRAAPMRTLQVFCEDLPVAFLSINWNDGNSGRVSRQPCVWATGLHVECATPSDAELAHAALSLRMQSFPVVITLNPVHFGGCAIMRGRPSLGRLCYSVGA
eukprot:358159-Chlamydomonas_euryale.AAC.3